MTVISTARAALRLGAFMPPWLLPMERDPTLAIRGEIETIEYLEKIGFREAWIGEHHSGGMEIVSSPELLIAAAIERTSRIRLGTGVISLPYHHPLTVADRVVQLDHQSQGRAMFGFGPGLLPSDAKMLGIPSTEQRDRLAEGLDVVLRLIAGETVTQRSNWFDLQEARLQIGPHTHPRPEIVVASAITPSGGLLAGRHGLGLLCVAASTGPGYDVLDVNWGIVQETAAEHGHVVDASGLRLVAPAHIAPTRDQAIAEIADGFARWDRHMREVNETGGEMLGMGSMDQLLAGGAIIGSPADAVESLEGYWEKTGGFGCLLYQLTPWASREHQRRSLRTFAEQVLPAFAGRTAPRRASHVWAQTNRDELGARARAGAEQAIAEHFGAPADAAGPVSTG
jgi:limonene 1,2-monooxygenase